MPLYSYRLVCGVALLSWLAAGCSSSTSPDAEGEGGAGGSGTAQAGTNHAAGDASGGTVSGQGGTALGGTSNHDQPNCESDFDELDRACDDAADCTLVEHQVDCCGSILLTSVPISSEAAFDALEQYCSGKYPACRCAAAATKLDDGTVLEPDAPEPIADCVEGRCRSRGDRRSLCGDLQCSETEYCEQFSGGAPGSEPTYSCKARGDCHECSCLQLSTACQCLDSEQGIRVNCAAP